VGINIFGISAITIFGCRERERENKMLRRGEKERQIREREGHTKFFVLKKS